jgi:hypothetical protein
MGTKKVPRQTVLIRSPVPDGTDRDRCPLKLSAGSTIENVLQIRA